MLLEGCNFDGDTPLVLAAAAGDLKAVKALLKSGADHRHSNQYGHTALVAAARNGNLYIVEELAKPDLLGNANQQLQLAMAWAAYEGHVDIVEFLLGQVHIHDVLTPDRDTPLTLAACAGRENVVKLLLKHDASMHHANASGDSALTLAAGAGHQACVVLLLDACSQLEHKNFCVDEIALALAAARKYRYVQLAILDFVEEAGYGRDQLQPKSKDERDINGNTNLMLAAANGDWRLVANLVAEGANTECSDSAGNTALLLGAAGGHTLALVNLLAMNAKVHRENENGDTALILAATRGHQDIVHHLLEHGANIDHVNKKGMNAQQCAQIAGHSQTANQLANANTLLADAGAGREKKVEGFLAHGPVNHVDRFGNTALILAAAAGHLEIVKLLVRNLRSGIYHANDFGDTALICAIQNKHVDVIKYLIGKVDSESLGGNNFDTALHLAASKGEHALIPNLCVSNPADLDAKNSKGYTALCCAAYEGYALAVRGLVTAGADILIRNNDGYDALQIAIHRKHVTVVEVLLDFGADPRSASFPESRMWALPYARSLGVSVSPESYDYAVISDLLRFSGPLLGKSAGGIGISVAPLALVDGLMNFNIAADGDTSTSWQERLKAQGVCSIIIVELECLTVNVGKVWGMLTDPSYRSATTEQKKMCCAGILTGLAELKLEAEWTKQLIAQGIGRQTLMRYGAMLARQQLWLANAGRYLESGMLVRMHGLAALCTQFCSGKNMVNAIALYRELQQMGIIHWLAEIIGEVYAHQARTYGADLSPRQFAGELLDRMNGRDFVERLDRSAHDTEDELTVFALTARQIMLLRYACKKLISQQ